MRALRSRVRAIEMGQCDMHGQGVRRIMSDAYFANDDAAAKSSFNLGGDCVRWQRDLEAMTCKSLQGCIKSVLYNELLALEGKKCVKTNRLQDDHLNPDSAEDSRIDIILTWCKISDAWRVKSTMR